MARRHDPAASRPDSNSTVCARRDSDHEHAPREPNHTLLLPTAVMTLRHQLSRIVAIRLISRAR